MLIKLPKIDRKLALLAGYEIGATCTVEVDMASLDADDRVTLVQALELHDDGTATLPLVVSLPEVGSILAAVHKAAADEAAKAATRERGWRELLGEFAGAAAVIEQLAPVQAEKVLYDDNGIRIGRYAGWKVPDYRAPSWYDGRATGRSRQEVDSTPEYRAYREAEQALEARAKALDEAARQAALPAALEAWREEQRVAAEKAAAAEAKREERLNAEAAERLASGYWERETGPYNHRRYGKPWCARVTGVDARGKLVYEWAEWTGRIGAAGVLRAACRPGEIVAWGQRDGRRADRSDHELERMDEAGRMHRISVVEAVKALRS